MNASQITLNISEIENVNVFLSMITDIAEEQRADPLNF